MIAKPQWWTVAKGLFIASLLPPFTSSAPSPAVSPRIRTQTPANAHRLCATLAARQLPPHSDISTCHPLWFDHWYLASCLLAISALNVFRAFIVTVPKSILSAFKFSSSSVPTWNSPLSRYHRLRNTMSVTQFVQVHRIGYNSPDISWFHTFLRLKSPSRRSRKCRTSAH